MVKKISTGAMKALCSREHVLMDFNLSSAPVEPTVQNQSTGAMKVLCSREHVWWTPTSLQHRLNRRFRIKAPVHWMYFVPERLFELISEPLQHRLNRCPYGACTGAMTQAWILCQNSNGYFFDTERPVEPMPIFSIPSVLPVVTVFLQKTSNGYVTSSTLYKGTPWFISVAF
jgi:hypothetical protein